MPVVDAVISGIIGNGRFIIVNKYGSVRQRGTYPALILKII